MRAEEVTLRLHDLPEGPMRDRVMSLMAASKPTSAKDKK